MTVSAVLLDLGGTLARYYTRDEFPAILKVAIDGVCSALADACVRIPAPSEVWARVEEENHEAADYAVRPLAGRLARIFDLPDPLEPRLSDEVCRAFMRPILALGTVYDDAIPTLRELRARDLRTAIVSNTPWGSPAYLWREELERLALADWVDATVFCTDVGWRKPDRRIFVHALELLGVAAADAVFVGDDPRWDIAGPVSLEMRPVLLQRSGVAHDALASRMGSIRVRMESIRAIATLHDLPPLLGCDSL